VSRYDSLAEHTVLMHGKLPSCGFWQPSGVVGGHLLLNVSAADYLDPPAGSDVFMPITILFSSSLDRFAMRSTFATSSQQTAQAKAPRPVSPLPSNFDGDVWLPWEENNFGQWVREKAQREGGSRDEPIMEFADFFQTLFGRPPPPVLQVAQGGQFTASRAALRRVPLATYRWLLGRLEQGHAEMPYYLELVWLYLLQPSKLNEPPPPSMPRTDSSEELLPFLHHLHGDAARRRASHEPYRPYHPCESSSDQKKACKRKWLNTEELREEATEDDE